MGDTEENLITFVEQVTQTDKNYVKYKLPLLSGKYYKQVTIECYGSGGQGTRIRNAVTGAYYNEPCYKVGSLYDDILFKIIDSTALNGRTDPLMLYYDTPEQYERHQYTTLSQQNKQRWVDKQFETKKLLKLL